MSKAKPFCISKHQVQRAYEKVKANRGAAGIDQQSLEDFEKNLKDNLYKIWNRMSSGSYFPPPVRTVEIPKKDGGVRKLGIPTVSDRIAQMVVKMELEPLLEPIFHEDSYGYRPKKSAHQAIDQARKRCWKKSWVIDLDIKGFFDNIDHELMLKAVRKHCENLWVLLYIERWLKAGVEENGNVSPRMKGTPQGGVISPLLANLFLHYAFDHWISHSYPQAEFERYADDLIVHCRHRNEALEILGAIKRRMSECHLEVHPEKTKIVYCRPCLASSDEGFSETFDFLGFTFRQRTAKNRSGEFFNSFLPAISERALRKIREEIRTWRVGKSSHLSLQEISQKYNPVWRGWVNYYGAFYPSRMQLLKVHWHQTLTNWAARKYKRFHKYKHPAGTWINSITDRNPKLFAIWELCRAKSQS